MSNRDVRQDLMTSLNCRQKYYMYLLGEGDEENGGAFHCYSTDER